MVYINFILNVKMSQVEKVPVMEHNVNNVYHPKIIKVIRKDYITNYKVCEFKKKNDNHSVVLRITEIICLKMISASRYNEKLSLFAHFP